MEKWNEKLNGFLYYIPGCERIKLIINGKEEFKGPVYNMPKKYQELEIEELRGVVNGEKRYYMQFVGHFKEEKPCMDRKEY